MKKIYLDHAATTSVDKKVLEAMSPYFNDVFGNPSSVHSFGQEAMKAVDEARQKVAIFLGCLPEEIIFTSGATEADNLAIRGVVSECQSVRVSECQDEKSVTLSSEKSGLKAGVTTVTAKPHIITTAFEHPAVLEVCKHLEKIGDPSLPLDSLRSLGVAQDDFLSEVTYVKPQSDGLVRVEDIEKEIKDNTVLISVMYVNNEIGTVQPIEEIGELVKKVNTDRMARDPSTRPDFVGPRSGQGLVLFHTDAVQAANYCRMDVKKLGVDLLSLSGHKIYGPKGIGILYIKSGTPIKPIQFGGHHEHGLRPGTLNTPLIVGLGKAVELVATRDGDSIKNLRDYLWQELQQKIKGVHLNGSLEKRVPNNLNISIEGAEGEAILLGLDLAGIAVSTGSACSSGSLEPSHVLMAIGLSHEEAHGSLRITLGKDNTKEEVDYLVKELTEIVARLRKMAPKG